MVYPTRWLLLLLLVANAAFGQGNTQIDSFQSAKRLLHEQVHVQHRSTLYCNASYNDRKQVTAPSGFITPGHEKRAGRIEWEHVVPAENFGRTFSEWRDGHPSCVNSSGKSYKGRRCADRTSAEYRLMQADMYNLYPAIGAVNAYRSNYNFTLLPGSEVDFGSCAMKIDQRKAEPPESARGTIARTYLYMAESYPRFRLSPASRKLMEAWNRQYPPQAWECQRGESIRGLQGNENRVLSSACNPQVAQH
ncbi:endonuclease [Pseudomaricurvus sp. HS19]|uniref:endonuclease n=1 Tax=Pseudomaricurvus sp. HS19 TaxID=2692626 RepID=UPI001371C683|nr:endonuclease I [Pseudomaricurvus sp. HS19]